MKNPASESETPAFKPSENAVVLAHISDIHFRKPVGNSDLYTPDDDLRHELKNDLDGMRQQIGAFHGILITGDVAFAGVPEEYKQAHAWLLDICGRTGCPEQCVRTISGNHDVIRSVIGHSIHLRNAHAALRDSGRQGTPDKINAQIADYFNDESVPELLFSSIANYNEFASKFFSNFRRSSPYWEWDIILNDGSTLRVRGLNSTLVSDSTDNRGDNKLVLGPLFCALPRREGIEYLVLCHHPPEWLWDNDSIDDYLYSRARIQLFGHKHIQRVREQNQGGFRSLRIHAGALNPDSGAREYLPRYNCLGLKVLIEGGQRVLQVDLHSRVWVAQDTRFEDGGACQTFKLPLPLWNRDAASAGVLLSHTAFAADPFQTVSDPLRVIGTDPAKARALGGPRRLAYRFLALPFPQRIEIANTLGLLQEEDAGQPDGDLFRRFFRRAAERVQLAALWREVEKRHVDGVPDDNPFENL